MELNDNIYINDLLDSNKCVCCGEIIPEGRQICINCEQYAKNVCCHNKNNIS